MYYIEKIEACAKKYRVLLANGDHFLLYGKDLRNFSLAENEWIEDITYSELMACLLSRGKERAYYLLGARSYSVAEIRRKLVTDGYPDSVIDEIISGLQSYRYLDDGQYGKQVVKSKKLKSKKEITQLLYQKGIQKEDITYALEDFDEEENLRHFIDKKIRDKVLDEAKIQKVIRACVSHGYNYELARRILMNRMEQDQSD